MQRTFLWVMLGLTAPAFAQEVGTPPPLLPVQIWFPSVAVVDFDTPQGSASFAAIVDSAHERTFVYVDWTFRNAARSGLFNDFTSEADPIAADQAICSKVEEAAEDAGGYVISGKPDSANNHLLFSMKVDLIEGAPFARARCEYSGNSQSLRIRGFYYVTNRGTATAMNREFTPVSPPINSIPPDLIQSLR